MKLYSYWRSTTSYRVRAALNLKELAYEIVPVDLVEGEQRGRDFGKLNPAHGVPVLELDDGTVLTQSLAILDYIETKWPEPQLIPADPKQRALVLAAAQGIALDIHPINNLKVINHLKAHFAASADDARGWMIHWMEQGFSAYEQLAAGSTPFSFSHKPDIADLCLVAQVYNARRWGVDMSLFPRISQIEVKCLDVPAIGAAHPDAQPEAKEVK